MLYFSYFGLVTLNRSVFLNAVFPNVKIEDVEVFRNFFSDVELYVANYFIVINIHESKVLYVLINNKWINDVWIRFSVINIHVLQLVVLEKVLKEAVTILLVFIPFTINPAQVLQWNDVISLVGDFFTVQVSQINTLVHVRYFNTYCR